MEKLQIISCTDFGELEMVIIDGKEYFPATQCAKILGYAKPADAVRVHCKGVFKMQTPTNGGNQTVNYISEGDLYRLIVKSKLPAADKFESWIFDEVLPAIRKTGGYVDNEDLFINTYLPFADDNTKTLFRTTLHTINQLNNKIEQDKPLVDFANHIQESDDCISMSEMSKLAAKNDIKIGRTRLFSFLREQKVLDKNNLPYQRYIETQPWFQVKEYTYAKGYDIGIGTITLVTPKGQVGIVNMLKKYYVQ